MTSRPPAGSPIRSAIIVAELHGEVGDVAAGFAAADVVHEGTYVTQRVQHAALETHGSIGWLDEAGRLVLRTSSQVPYLTRRALCSLYDLPEDKVRVFSERVGGGFGGKQEMLTEDIVALAVLKTGRPVKLELTREEQFAATTSRHPMRITVKIGATRDGRLTAISMRMLSEHRRLRQSRSRRDVSRGRRNRWRSIAARTSASMASRSTPIRCRAGAFRGYGLSQTNFAIESAIDEVAAPDRHGPVRVPSAQCRQAGRSDGVLCRWRP